MKIPILAGTVFILILIPILIKGSFSRKKGLNFLLGFPIVFLLCTIELESRSHSKEEAIMYVVNVIGYVFFHFMSVLHVFVKQKRDFFFFFPVMAAFILLIPFISIGGNTKYSYFMLGNILLAFFPCYIDLYWLQYHKKPGDDNRNRLQS